MLKAQPAAANALGHASGLVLEPLLAAPPHCRHSIERLEALRALQQKQQVPGGLASNEHLETLQAELEASKARTLALEQELTSQQYRLEVGAASSQDMVQLKGALEAAHSELASARAQWEAEKGALAHTAAELWRELQQVHTALEEAVDKVRVQRFVVNDNASWRAVCKTGSCISLQLDWMSLPAACKGTGYQQAVQIYENDCRLPAHSCHHPGGVDCIASWMCVFNCAACIMWLCDLLSWLLLASIVCPQQDMVHMEQQRVRLTAALAKPPPAIQTTIAGRGASDTAAAGGGMQDMSDPSSMVARLAVGNAATTDSSAERAARERADRRVAVLTDQLADARAQLAAAGAGASASAAQAEGQGALLQQQLAQLSFDARAAADEAATRMAAMEVDLAEAKHQLNQHTQQGSSAQDAHSLEQRAAQLQTALAQAAAAKQQLAQLESQLLTEQQRTQAAEHRAEQACLRAAAAHSSLLASQARSLELERELANSRVALQAAQAAAADEEDSPSPIGRSAADVARLADEVERLQKQLVQVQVGC